MATGAISPGPSEPRFDPPIRPPEERSGILFPIDACWLLDAHSDQAEELYARVEMDMGAARLRRKYTKIPTVRRAKIFLTSNEARKFHEWFELTLGVGQLRFIAPFHDIGRGVRWFEAEFTKPWEADLVPLGERNEDGNAARAWRISVEVRLYGNGLEHNPLLDPSARKFSAHFRAPLLSEGKLDVVAHFAARFSCPLESFTARSPMEAEFVCPLESAYVNPNVIYAGFFCYLDSTVKMNGRILFEAEFIAS